MTRWSPTLALLLAVALRAQPTLPEAPERKIVEKVCGTCHDVGTATGARHTKAGWNAVIDAMANRGARATEQEFDAIAEYLTKYFGAPNENRAMTGRARGPDVVGTVEPRKLRARNDWPVFNGDPGGRRYSKLTRINTRNVPKLKLAWQYGIDPGGIALRSAEGGAPILTEAVPILAEGRLYTPTPQHTIVALEPETGKEIWKFSLGRVGAPMRGVSYWPGDRDHPSQVLAGTMDGKLVALNARTGKLVPGFGREGVVDLRPGVADKFPNDPYKMSSPGTIFRNLIITGAQGKEDDPDGPAMDVRAWDLLTGKIVWTFHAIPHPGEAGYETWPKNNWITAGSPANWGAATIDEQRGLVFLPIGQPAAQYYGGARHGDNLYSSSIVALDAATGKLRWHFQITHHDVWDYDAEAAPSLMEVVRHGRKIPVVVAVSKSGLMFFLERETGKSVYAVEERAVPQSDVPGEQTSPTQPFPLKPPPLTRQSITSDEIFKGEPEHEKFCRELAEKIGGIRNLGMYTPYSTREFRVIFPGQQGGPNFGGVAVDPKLNYVILNTRNVAGMGRMDKSPEGDPVAFRRFSPLGTGSRNARFWNPATQMPCQQPPWAELMAVNANTAEIAWRVPLGTSDEMEAKGIHGTGSFGQGGPIATAGGVVFIAGTIDQRFRAFDSRTGQVLWEVRLDSAGYTNPMTYLGRDGKQYVVIVSSGVNAFVL